MSKYTITIQEYCQRVYLGQVLELNPDADPITVVEGMYYPDYYRIVRDYLFPSNFDFYTDDAAAKETFIRDFTDYFMYYEIGQDSVPRFRHQLRAFLNTEMDYYKQLYDSQLNGLDDILKTVDVTREIFGKILERTGSVSSHDSTKYGHKEDRNGSSSQNGSITKGTTDQTNIVPLGSNSMRPLSQQAQGGADRTQDNVESSDSIEHSGTDTHEKTDTYNTTDRQDLTELRHGREGVNVGDAVEKFRKLIVDINSDILHAMKKAGLFMLVW